MSLPSYNECVLSVLIFSPLVAAGIAGLMKNENLLRWWTLAFTTALAVFSLPLYGRFDLTTAAFQFTETANWIPALVGVVSTPGWPVL